MLRNRGDRDAWQVPANELQALSESVRARESNLDRAGHKRKLAELLEAKRYSGPLDELLESVLGNRLPSEEAASTTSADATEDRVRELARQLEVEKAYDAFLAVAASNGLGLRHWPKSVTLTPPGNSRFTLVYVAPKGRGRIEIGWSEENFERFLGVTSQAVRAAAIEVWAEQDVDAAVEAAQRLDALLGDVGIADASAEPQPTASDGDDAIDLSYLREAVERRDDTFDTWDVIDDEQFRAAHIGSIGTGAFNSLVGRALSKHRDELGIEHVGADGRRGSALWRKREPG